MKKALRTLVFTMVAAIGGVASAAFPPGWNPFGNDNGSPNCFFSKIERHRSIQAKKFLASSSTVGSTPTYADVTLSNANTVTIGLQIITGGATTWTYEMYVMLEDGGIVVNPPTGEVLNTYNIQTSQWGYKVAAYRLYEGQTIQLAEKLESGAGQYVTIAIVRKASGVIDSGYVIRKQLVVESFLSTAKTIDTRLTFGQPNAVGEIAPDPNATEGFVNFVDWKFKGGLFAGNMTGKKDKSGLSRTQFLTSGAPNAENVGAATLSVVDRGPLENVPTSGYLGIFAPLVSDANLTASFTGLTWASRWTSINPNGTAENSAEKAIDSYLPHTTGVEEYANLKLTYWLPTSSYVATTHELKHQVLALDNENTIPSWRYFLNVGFIAPSTFGIPSANFQPRLLTIKPPILLSGNPTFYPWQSSSWTSQ